MRKSKVKWQFRPVLKALDKVGFRATGRVLYNNMGAIADDYKTRKNSRTVIKAVRKFFHERYPAGMTNLVRTAMWEVIDNIKILYNGGRDNTRTRGT